jgi:hypothetical protein
MFTIFRKFPLYTATIILTCGILLLTGCVQTLDIVGENDGINGNVIKIRWKIRLGSKGSDLVSLDANQALLNLSLSNANISSTTGIIELSVTDPTTGQTLGLQSFGFVASGNSLYAQDPAAVYNWLQQFTGYSNIAVNVDVSSDLQTISSGSASAIGSSQYQGVTYGSATVSWSSGVSGPRNLNPVP